MACAPLLTVALAVSLALSAGVRPSPDLSSLGKPESVAPGVELYRLSDPSLLSPPGVVAVQLLRIEPRRARLDLVLAQDTVLGLETVPSMAARSLALAAVNAGFFLPTGEPAGLFKIDGEFLSDISLHRGAVALLPGGFARAPRLMFDQVRAHAEIDVRQAGACPAEGGTRARRTVRMDGVNATRGPQSARPLHAALLDGHEDAVRRRHGIRGRGPAVDGGRPA